jgi:hypothetical protein
MALLAAGLARTLTGSGVDLMNQFCPNLRTKLTQGQIYPSEILCALKTKNFVLKYLF